jgi:Protein of unknown function (DUF1116)
MQLTLSTREKSNRHATALMTDAEPALVDVRPAGEIVPGFAPNLILTSGPTLLWSDYEGGQRDAIIGAAQFEGLAKDRADAIAKLDAEEIKVLGCHEFSCVGSLAGVYTASMPVFKIENQSGGNIAYCNMYEGTNPRRLNFGVYGDDVRERLLIIQNDVVPVIAEAVRRAGAIPLKPILKRALTMGDELHSRNAASGLLFLRELVPSLLDMARDGAEPIAKAVKVMTEDHYFFLRLSMAAAKATADAAHNVEGASIVTAMCYNCREFALRVSGLGNTWFKGPHASVDATLFDGHTEDEITWMGGESTIIETVGLGGFAQACAPALQRYQGGSYEKMIDSNNELYRIVAGENPDYLIPAVGFRGTPTGIDIFKVIETGVLPVMDIAIAGRDGGQIGAGIVRAPLPCFQRAASAYTDRYC